MARTLQEGEVLPHPAEDLSADDDLLSWILVDQLGCLPNTKLGVHPQQVKFVGPAFKTSEILSIVQETVVETNLPEALRRLLDFHLIKGHLETKVTEGQKERFVQHLRRYLLPLLPTSRIEIYTTDRYTSVTGHVELAVYATRPLPIGAVIQELQGSVVPLPDAWREEMEIGEDFALDTAAEENGSGNESGGNEEDGDGYEDDRDRRDSTAAEEGGGTSRKGRRKREPKGARRSDRTKRRDFSIVWSGLKRCFQLFLGPARFLNHDCNPNVELLRQGKYVTFRVIRPIRIGDEVTTFYGDSYFGKDNIECLCLTCEKTSRGGFTGASTVSETATRSLSPSMSASVRFGSPSSSRRPVKPSALRNALSNLDIESQGDEEDQPVAGPSGTQRDQNCDPTTPMKLRPKASLLYVGGMDSPATDGTRSDPGSPSEDQPPRRERYHRKAAKNAQHFSFLKRPKKAAPLPDESVLFDDEDEDCVRCATCAKPLHERIWYNNKYFDHCARCVRHALIFDLPWPSHRSSEVLDYPPSHLIPYGYIPPRVSSIALPSLDKNRKKHVEPAPVSPQGESIQDKRGRKFRDELALESLEIEQLREAAWTAQDTAESQALAIQQAKITAKEKRAEAKRVRDETRIKGSGVWQRYEYISEDEILKREAARNAVTSGTRRGGRFKADEDEAERVLVEEARQREVEESRAQESDADDEGEDDQAGPDHGDAGNDKAGPDHGDAENDQAGPLVSPTRETLKVEPPDSATRLRMSQARVRRPGSDSKSTINPMPVIDVIDISADSDESSGIEDEEAWQRKMSARKAAEAAALESDHAVAETESPPKAPLAEKKSESAPKVKKPKALAKTKPKVAAPARNDDTAPTSLRTHVPVDRESESRKRGRGRPSGSGKHQKAAALQAIRAGNLSKDRHQAVAGPSRTSKQRSATPDESDEDNRLDHLARMEKLIASVPVGSNSNPRKRVSIKLRAPEVEEPTDVLSRMEAKLSILGKSSSTKRYDWYVEGLDDDGKFCLKYTGETTSYQCEADVMLIDFLSREKQEFQSYWSGFNTPGESVENHGTDEESKKTRRLPGQRRLLSRAEVKAWSEIAKSDANHDISTMSLEPNTQLPPLVPNGVEFAGIILDPNTLRGYGRPSDTEGPWYNGQYRLFATAERSQTTQPLVAGQILGACIANGNASGSPSKRSSAPFCSTPAHVMTSGIELPGGHTSSKSQSHESVIGGKRPSSSNSPSHINWPSPKQTIPPNGVRKELPRNLGSIANIVADEVHAPKTIRTSSTYPVVGGILLPADHSEQVNGNGRDHYDNAPSQDHSTTVSPAEAEVEEVLNGNGKRMQPSPGTASRKRVPFPT